MLHRGCGESQGQAWQKCFLPALVSFAGRLGAAGFEEEPFKKVRTGVGAAMKRKQA